MSSKPEPRMWSRDTGQQLSCSRYWVWHMDVHMEVWMYRRMDSDVTTMFVGSVGYQIFKGMGLCLPAA